MIRTSLILPLLMAGPAFAAERGYPVSDFEQVHVTGGFAVEVRTGRATTVKARGTVQAMDNVSVRVTGRALVIQPNAGPTFVSSGNNGPLPTFFITLPRLSSARLLGSGTLTVAELRGAQGDVALTGSGSVRVEKVMTDRLAIKQSGEGQLFLAGKTLSLEASGKGAGGIDASGLFASDLKLSAANSGIIRMAASRSANIAANGPGIVEIIGRPACSVQNRGSGEVRCGR